MELPILKPLDTPVEELDTPALVADISTLEQNIETVHSFFRQRKSKLRPFVESHRCPDIARKQLDSEGATAGIGVYTVGEAEAFFDKGFTDFFIANEVVSAPKINRLCSLARRANITLAADNPENVTDLSQAATAQRVNLNVVVDVNTRLNRCGTEPGSPSVELARAINKASNLEFAGLMTYEGAILTEDKDQLTAESKQCVQKVLDTREMIQKAGMDVRIVSVGGTHNYDVVGEIDGVTEVPAGSYALMDARYQPYRAELRPAAKVMATVVSCPEPGRFIVDAGHKCIAADPSLPVVAGIPGLSMAGLSAEHGTLITEVQSSISLDLGSKIWLIPWEAGTCANLHDYIHAVRNGKLEAMYEVAARGRYR